MPRRARKAGRVQRLFISTHSAAAHGGDRTYRGTDFLGHETRHSLFGDVCEWEVPFGREDVDDGSVHQEDQEFAGEGEGRVGEAGGEEMTRGGKGEIREWKLEIRNSIRRGLA